MQPVALDALLSSTLYCVVCPSARTLRKINVSRPVERIVCVKRITDTNVIRDLQNRRGRIRESSYSCVVGERQLPVLQSQFGRAYPSEDHTVACKCAGCRNLGSTSTQGQRPAFRFFPNVPSILRRILFPGFPCATPCSCCLRGTGIAGTYRQDLRGSSRHGMATPTLAGHHQATFPQRDRHCLNDSSRTLCRTFP